jgi:hypothetical protein
MASARWAMLRQPSEPDADTIRRRALEDARGTVLRQIDVYSASGTRHWQIVRSVLGRTNQLDLILDGHVVATGGARVLLTANRKSPIQNRKSLSPATGFGRKAATRQRDLRNTVGRHGDKACVW